MLLKDLCRYEVILLQKKEKFHRAAGKQASESAHLRCMLLQQSVFLPLGCGSDSSRRRSVVPGAQPGRAAQRKPSTRQLCACFSCSSLSSNPCPYDPYRCTPSASLRCALATTTTTCTAVFSLVVFADGTETTIGAKYTPTPEIQTTTINNWVYRGSQDVVKVEVCVPDMLLLLRTAGVVM